MSGFIGRDTQLRWLSQRSSSGDSSTGVVIAAIAGAPGVGKTALALRWAHQVRDRFPDGQLYVNLGGYARGAEISPLTALSGFLDALGIPSERVPVDLDQAAAVYRSLLTGRRVLVLLDNAASAAQVRPLLPGSAGCLALVTSRKRLSGLTARDGAHRLTLDVLSPDEGVALLRAGLAPERVDAEPDALGELTTACAHLPLALRITLALLNDHPDRSIADQVEALNGDDWINVLSIEDDPDTAVGPAFELSYRALPTPAQRMFRLLGIVPTASFTAPAVTALTGLPRPDVDRMLDRLAAAHLIGPSTLGRYTTHDLLRRYAAIRASESDSEPVRAAAIGQQMDWYLATADSAAQLLYPQMLRLPLEARRTAGGEIFADPDAALAWLGGERRNLAAVITHAAEHGPRPLAWLLADTLRGYYFQSRHMIEWLDVTRAGLVAAEQDGDLRAQAAMKLSLGTAEASAGRGLAAIEHYASAADLAKRSGWVDGEAAIAGNLGNVHAEVGRLPPAIAAHTRAWRLYQQSGRLAGQANTLCNLGYLARQLGDLRIAADHHAEALRLFRQLGSVAGEAQARENLGETEHDLGRLESARDHLEAALALHGQLGNRYGEAGTLLYLAGVRRDAGQLAAGHQLVEAAAQVAADLDDERIEAEASNVLGTIQLRLRHPREALAAHRRALDLARDASAHYSKIVATLGLAEVAVSQHDWTGAADLADRARHLAQHAGYRVLEANARTTLAAAHLASGRGDQATEAAYRALTLHAQTGHRLGEARTLTILSQIADTDAELGALWSDRARATYLACGVPDGTVEEMLNGAPSGRRHPRRPSATA
ncbi:ATP-binding protein [Cryptosporangium sp. NPDC051539]|uniref:ATP-binding protein n=1 Tax=Cryptosporangium sp. NPDC051539 TaxID=3363962 RepID=UPI00378CA863